MIGGQLFHEELCLLAQIWNFGILTVKYYKSYTTLLFYTDKFDKFPYICINIHFFLFMLFLDE